MSRTCTMVREIVITTDRQKENGIDSEERKEFNISVMNRVKNGMRNIWNGISEESKWFCIDTILALISLLILFFMVVIVRLIIEHLEDHSNFPCRLIESIDNWLGTSLTLSFCTVRTNLIERFMWHSDNLSNEIKEGITSFIDQLADGFTAVSTIFQSVSHHYLSLMSDGLKELCGNVEENIQFLSQFIQSGLHYISSTFLSSIQETNSTTY